MVQKGKKGEIFLKKNEAIASRGWKHGFFWKPRSEKRNQKGTCCAEEFWEARLFPKLLKDLTHLGRSSRSRVESSSSNGPFFLFCFNNCLGRLRFPFFFLFSFNPHVLRFIVLARWWTGVEYGCGGGDKKITFFWMIVRLGMERFKAWKGKVLGEVDGVILARIFEDCAVGN